MVTIVAFASSYTKKPSFFAFALGLYYLCHRKQNRQFIKTILSLNKTRLKDLKFVLYGIFCLHSTGFFYK